jgi:hypothetical protein
METALFTRFMFLRETRRVYNISQDTGIPYSTLYRYATRQAKLPAKWENNLYNAYARETYNRARQLGYDVATAKQRQYWNPQRWHLSSASNESRTTLYTYLNVKRKYPDETMTLKQATHKPEWASYFERISKAIKEREIWIKRHPEIEYKYADERGW